MASLLVVDDDAELAAALEGYLCLQGHEVRTAGNGKEALLCLRAAQPPDVILLDVEMPVMTGPEMTQQMLLHDAGEENIPVVLVSARADLSQIARQLGTPYFVAKADIESLEQVLERALREREAPRRARSELASD